MSLRAAVATACEGREVPAPVLEAAFGEIMDGGGSDLLCAALLVALRTKGETVSELVAAARAVRARARQLPCPDPRAVDTCGTGGDGASTFNVSTAAAFVVAGAGVPVAKHGNRAASSRAGSIDVLEALGVKVEIPVEAAAKLLVEIGIAPFFARVAHPAMRRLAPVREALGVRTLMNCLGPLLNPVGVRFQLVGVYSASLLPTLASALGQLGSARALVVHGGDGLDEITTTTHTDAVWLEDGRLHRLRIEPGPLGIEPARPEDLRGGDAAQNAEIVRAVLAGEPGARRDIVLLNAAAALWVAGAAGGLAEGLSLARRSLDEGAAARKLALLVAASKSAP
jgi:anthranilate phosphoribosyltransferase